MTEKQLQVLRARRWRTEAPNIRSEEEALGFIDELGVVAEFSHKSLPTLYGAVHSEEPPDEKGWNWDRIDRTWHSALGLARRKRIYYGKLFGGNTVLISLRVLAPFLNVYAPVDYLEEYFSGRLARLGKEIMDLLMSYGVQSSEDLKARLAVKGKEGAYTFKKALSELQAKGLISTVGAVKRGRSGWEVLLWDAVEHWIPEEVRRDRDRIDPEDALIEVLWTTVNAMTYTTANEVRRTLRLKIEDVQAGLEHLVETGRLARLTREDGTGLYHTCSKGGP